MSEDYYRILGIDQDAGPERIRQAYRKAAKRFHPDFSGRQESAERFRQVEEAWETLRDPEKRQAYDRRLGRQARSSIPATPRPGEALRETARPLRERNSAGAADAFSAGTTGTEATLEVLLSSDEAARGVEVPLEIPTVRRCLQCAEQGFWARLSCPICWGSGRIQTRRLC